MAQIEQASGPDPSWTLRERALWAFAKLARRDLSGPEEIWAVDAVDHFLPVGDAVGREAIVAFFDELFAAFPDLVIEVENVVTGGSVAVVQWHARGTFTGRPFQAIRPTGRPVAFRGCDVIQMRDGLVQENTVYWDGAQFARQIGMLPARGSRADRAVLAAFNAVTWARTRGGRSPTGRR